MSEEIKRRDRDETGKFVKGHKVPSPRTGRRARGDVMPVLMAVAEASYSAEELVDMIHETYDIAKDEKDWKGMFTVIQFVVNYAVGKPVQRTLSATINPDDLRAFFKGGKDEARMAERQGRSDEDRDSITVEGTVVEG